MYRIFEQHFPFAGGTIEILGLQISYIIAAGLAWLIGSYLFWAFIARPMMKKWIKSTIIGMLADPDEDTKAAISAIFSYGWNWFLTAEIKTDKKIKEIKIVEITDPETGEITQNKEFTGKLIDEKLTPYQALINESVRVLFNKLSAKMGGDAKALGNLLSQDPSLAPLMAMGGGPQKGESTVEYALRSLLVRLAPRVENIVVKKLEEIINNTVTNP